MSGALHSPKPRSRLSPKADANAVAKRLDRPAALRRYVELGPDRSYERLAREFGISSTTIRKWAAREGWVALAENADRKAAEKALAQGERTREQRAAKNRRILDLLDDQLETKVEAGGLEDKDAIRLRADAYRQYLLDIGEVTDRISIPEVREFVGRFVSQIDELLVAVLDDSLANGKRQVVLRAFRERMPEVLEQAAIEGPAA